MLRLLLLVALAFAAVFVAERVRTHWTSPPAAPPVARRPSAGAPLDYRTELHRLDLLVDGNRALLRTQGDSWLQQERLANACIARARLTGSFEDFAAAQRALDQGFATAPAGAGPQLTQAVLDLSMHRLAHASLMLDAIDRYAVRPERETLDETGAMRGDIAFYRGDYPAARAIYAAGAAADAEASFRMAVYAARTGRIDDALAMIDSIEQSLRFPTAQGLARLDLLRGTLELQRGDWALASARFARADALFPGYWLIEAHRAQMLALAGNPGGAIRWFERLARHNPGPELMDALAALYRARGDRVRSAAWAARAGIGWTRRLALFPEAAYGHAVEHHLAFGDAAVALDLAKRDFAARPHGATATALAWAYVASGRPADARRVLRPVLASAWVSADPHIAAAQAALLLGDSATAQAERDKAVAINPRSLDPAAALIWFGH